MNRIPRVIVAAYDGCGTQSASGTGPLVSRDARSIEREAYCTGFDRRRDDEGDTER